MGTGGGEYLLSLKHPYANTCATEAYPPNYELCNKKLVPLGIDVRQVFDDAAIPFEASKFDVILNRHESYNVYEVYRLLKPGGLFITQQVGGLNNKKLGHFILDDFKEIVDSEHNLKKNSALFVSQCFTIIKADEFFPKLKFLDIGALVYFAKIIEWEFPGFSVESSFEKLCKLQADLERQGYIESMEHRFLIVAQKPIN
jgi:SAM-dependent methyltransferase